MLRKFEKTVKNNKEVSITLTQKQKVKEQLKKKT